MEFLIVIPNRVTNPTIDPIDNHPPVKMIAITPPIKQKGRLAKTINKLTFELRAIRKMRATKKSAIVAFRKSADTLWLDSVAEPRNV